LAIDLQRALDIGFMYGGLIAHRSSEAQSGPHDEQMEAVAETYSNPLPETIARGLYEAQAGLDLEQTNDNYLFFRRLRAIEVNEGGSDILAFCLAATQDHISAEFNGHRQSETPFTLTQQRRLQSLYYAGALVGAFIAGDDESRNRQKVEIMRSSYAEKEPISLRMEFEPGDDISAALEYLLGSKLTFSYVDNGYEEPHVAILPAGIQFGPNSLSIPLHVPRLEGPEMTYRVPLKDIKALFVAHQDPNSSAVEKFVVINDVAEYLANPNENTKLAGLLLPGGCVATYHQVHPNASVIHDLASRITGIPISELNYSSELVHKPKTSGWSTNKRLGMYAAASVASVWATEIVEYALIKDKSIQWEQDITVSAIVLAGASILAYAKNVLKKTGKEHDEDYQKLLDQFTLPQ
jgi:hypothetical protein